MYLKQLIQSIENYRGKGYHTIAYKNSDGKYKIDPDLYKEYSMTFYGIIKDEKDKIIIDILKPLEKKNKIWLSFQTTNNFDRNGGLYLDKDEGIKYMYENYTDLILNYIQSMIQHGMDVWEHSNLEKNWNDFEKFKQKVESDNYPILIIYKNLDGNEGVRYDFQIISVNVPN